MQKIEIKCNENGIRILDFLTNKIDGVPYGVLLKALKNKDIRIDDKKINENITICNGQKITIFLEDEIKEKKYFEIIFKDDNIIIVNKEKNIEVCDGNFNVQNELEKSGERVFAVHRLDRNTSGLVIFARNNLAKNGLIDAFKKHQIRKYYLAEVMGKPKEEEKTMTAFLVKDAEKSTVKIFANKKENSAKIITKYKIIKSSGNTSLLEVEIPTGKTHQIRAHLAHIGYPIVGDDKYGDREENKKYKQKTQSLIAYKITFEIDEANVMSYLNKKKFELSINYLNNK